MYLNNDFKVAINFFLWIAPKPKVESKNELFNFLNAFGYIIFLLAHYQQKNARVVTANLKKWVVYSQSNNLQLTEFIMHF